MPCALPACAAFRPAVPRAPSITALPNSGGVVSVSGHGGVPPWPGPRSVQVSAAGGRRVMSHAPATGTRFAFTYCAVLQSGRSRSAKAPLGAAHRCAPLRVYKTHNMQSALRWGWAPSRRRSPVACAPYAPPPGRPVMGVAPWLQSGATRRILVSGLRPGATGTTMPARSGRAPPCSAGKWSMAGIWGC